MANSFNAASSSSPMMTRSCKYRIKFLIIQVALLPYIYLLSLPYLFLSLLNFKQMLHKQVTSFCTIQGFFLLYTILMVNFVLVRICHSSYNSFHMGNHTDSCQLLPFLNNLLVMKNSHCQRFMPNLCYIIYIDLFIRTFGLQTTLNDSSLIKFVLYLTKMMGE